MTAHSSSCVCDTCGYVCTGRFDGCQDVWARGPTPVSIVGLGGTEVARNEAQFRPKRESTLPGVDDTSALLRDLRDSVLALERRQDETFQRIKEIERELAAIGVITNRLNRELSVDLEQQFVHFRRRPS
jgi:hypothetical protein